MSVRFASTNHPVRRLGWRAAGRGLIAPALARASNDNGHSIGNRAAPPAMMDPVLTAALRHFAVHGLASAETAISAAADAAGRGDAQAQDHWLAITRMFDRRLAARALSGTAPA